MNVFTFGGTARIEIIHINHNTAEWKNTTIENSRIYYVKCNRIIYIILIYSKK